MASKLKRQREESVDRISLLPDEVLGLILSSLTAKQATATSILSTRWRHLWIFTPKLDLDGSWITTKPHSMTDLTTLDSLKQIQKQKSKFIRWADGVIASHQSSHLHEFRLCFDLGQSYTNHINRWLTYALSRRVQSLDLNLMDPTRYRHMCYTFPYDRGYFPHNLKVLKKLGLHFVSVSGETVELLLKRCPLLEQLSLSGTKGLSSLEIVGTFPSFKCLEIYRCQELQTVVLSDSDVVAVKYSGAVILRFRLINVPFLSQLWIEETYERLGSVVKMFASVFPQLEMFKIYASSVLSWSDSIHCISAVKMCGLKQLVVTLGEAYSKEEYHLLPVINLIGVSPCLQRFVVEAAYAKLDRGASRIPKRISTALKKISNLRGREISKKDPRVYFHLKEVEFVGYSGLINQFQMIEHFVKNDVALEKIVVDTRRFEVYKHRPWDFVSQTKNIEDGIVARDYAKKQLQKCIPSRINLNIF